MALLLLEFPPSFLISASNVSAIMPERLLLNVRQSVCLPCAVQSVSAAKQKSSMPAQHVLGGYECRLEHGGLGQSNGLDFPCHALELITVEQLLWHMSFQHPTRWRNDGPHPRSSGHSACTRHEGSTLVQPPSQACLGCSSPAKC